ncbi:Inositolphosphorylceramide synthase subunit Kei1-domain-containing protein [Sporodiniella umbellata]|nr:Inositolphosphorylceramide synthase subunit Kei1-domain-containing protein [Sporodiniella umbellata]
MSPNKENNCLFIPLKTGVYAIIAIGILNKLSGLYGLLFLRYQSTSIVISHLYSVVGLVFFAFGLYGVSKDHRSVFKVYLVFYWVDLLINTAATTYFSIQVFGEYSRSQIDLLSDRQQILEHNKESKSDCNTVLIVLACIKITQVEFALYKSGLILAFTGLFCLSCYPVLQIDG